MQSSALIEPEVLEIESISLNEEVRKGLVPAQVAFIKESAADINEELLTAGQCIRAVAAHLFEIKSNIKPGNWKAFLKSGAINISERNAVDLVNAHEKWLGGSDVEDHLIAGLSARALNAMGAKGVTDKERSKVFDLAAKGESMPDSKVRKILRGSSISRSRKPRTVDERVENLTLKLEQLTKANERLRNENKKLRDLVSHGSGGGSF